MLGNLGVGELIVIATICAVLIIPLWRILGKAGLNQWLSLFCVVPLANLLLLYYIAYAKWTTASET